MSFNIFTRFLARPSICRLLGSAAVLACMATSGHAQVAVVTAHNDNARTGQNLKETFLTTRNVGINTFGKLFERTVAWKIWSQPLYLSAVTVPGKGVHNVVYVETETGDLYAFDADFAAQSAPLWHQWLIGANFTGDFSVGTPVIDPATKTIYCTVRKKSNNVSQFWLYALDAATGAQKLAPVQITATVAGTGLGSTGGQQPFLPSAQKQRPALLLNGGTLYIGFGGSVNEFTPGAIWNGWIFAYNAATLQQTAVLCIAPNANGGGVWQAANGMAADAQGNVYVTTGNGNGNPYSFTANTGGHDYGNCLLKLNPNATIASYFSPFNQAVLELADLDFGSSGPMLIPNTNWVVCGDKIGHLYLANRDNLGGFQAGSNSQLVQDFQAWNGHLHGGPVYFNSPVLGPLLYGWSEHDYLKAYQITSTGLITTPRMKSRVAVPPGMPGGFLSLSSNGNLNGSSILWANTPYLGDANKGDVPGVLHAFDANDLTRELWNSKQLPGRDDLGTFAKFSNPTIANGRVYAATFSNKLVVYGLLPKAALPAAPTALSATAGLLKVDLSWTAAAGATSYTLRRGTVTGGPYSTLANNVVGTSFLDTSIKAGTHYFYVVAAANSGGWSPNSNEANATPFAPAASSVISVDFVGGSTDNGTPSAMATTEIAGAIPVANWNAAVGSNGSMTGLHANGGVAIGTAVTWSALVTGSTAVADTAGNGRMMKGYIVNDQTHTITITVSNIPSSFVAAGYDVVVYSDGVNPASTKTGNFAIGSASVNITDCQNRDFEGTFVAPGIAEVGNYGIVPNIATSSFTLTITNAASTDAASRTPINGLQIVAHQNSSSLPPQAPVLGGKAGNSQVQLSWNGVIGGLYYTVKRGTQAAGPFTAMGGKLTSTDYTDFLATNGTQYFYEVTATGSAGESAPSNVVAATPSSAYVGSVISVDFGGGSTAVMAATEVAGAPGVAKSNWYAARFASGGKADLLNDQGVATTTDINWQSGAVGDTAITDTAGGARMMRGYIKPKGGNATISIFNLPAEFTTAGYDVYVYFDSNNPTATRTGSYTIGSVSTTATDTRGVDFGGNYLLANGGAGNYVKLLGFNTASFVLTLKPLTSEDAVEGASISGMQIVARNTSVPSAPLEVPSAPAPSDPSFRVSRNPETLPPGERRFARAIQKSVAQ